MELLVPLLVEVVIGLFDPKPVLDSKDAVSDLLGVSLPHSDAAHRHLEEAGALHQCFSFFLLPRLAELLSEHSVQLTDGLSQEAWSGAVLPLPIQLSELRESEPQVNPGSQVVGRSLEASQNLLAANEAVHESDGSVEVALVGHHRADRLSGVGVRLVR